MLPLHFSPVPINTRKNICAKVSSKEPFIKFALRVTKTVVCCIHELSERLPSDHEQKVAAKQVALKYKCLESQHHLTLDLSYKI